MALHLLPFSIFFFSLSLYQPLLSLILIVSALSLLPFLSPSAIHFLYLFGSFRSFYPLIYFPSPSPSISFSSSPIHPSSPLLILLAFCLPIFPFFTTYRCLLSILFLFSLFSPTFGIYPLQQLYSSLISISFGLLPCQYLHLLLSPIPCFLVFQLPSPLPPCFLFSPCFGTSSSTFLGGHKGAIIRFYVQYCGTFDELRCHGFGDNMVWHCADGYSDYYLHKCFE